MGGRGALEKGRSINKLNRKRFKVIFVKNRVVNYLINFVY